MKHKPILLRMVAGALLAAIVFNTSATVVFAGCWKLQTVQCATAGVSTCLVFACEGINGIKIATCYEDAFYYKAVTTTTSGRDLTKSAPSCIFAATYTDCDNNVSYTTCGPFGTITTIDFENSSACPVGG